jgi:exopolyphosphatase/guanosine-5'-triphosphate,3'-diphosphate pyrophosphatase
MRLAVVDIGSHSLHLVIVGIRADNSVEIVARERTSVRLGGGSPDEVLDPDARRASLSALTHFRRLIHAHHSDDVIAVASNAVREAEDGSDFLEAVFRETRLRVRVISGGEEARLIHAAALAHAGAATESTVVVRIGGETSQISRSDGSIVTNARSFKLGGMRLAAAFMKTDPLSQFDGRRLVRHLHAELAVYLDTLREAGVTRAIGTSGTMTTLGRLAAALSGAPGDALPPTLTVNQLHGLRRALAPLTRAERLGTPSLDPQRAEHVLAGAMMALFIFRRLGVKVVALSDAGVRDGLVLDYISRNRRRLDYAIRFPDRRRRGVFELAAHCGCSEAHAQQVARVALTLFDGTSAVHGLGKSEREWLEYAALLHDTGAHVNRERHHKHSYYLITNADLPGLAPREREMIGLVARYHRRSEPKSRHEEFASLTPAERRTVQWLGAILRLAEALDRTHAQKLTRVAIQEAAAEWRLAVESQEDAALELAAAQEQKHVMQKLLRKPLRLDLRAASLDPSHSRPRRAGADGKPDRQLAG